MCQGVVCGSSAEEGWGSGFRGQGRAGNPHPIMSVKVLIQVMVI